MTLKRLISTAMTLVLLFAFCPGAVPCFASSTVTKTVGNTDRGITNVIYPQSLEIQTCDPDFWEKMNLPKAVWSIDELTQYLPKDPLGLFPQDEKAMIDAIKQDRDIPLCDDFYSMHGLYVVTVEEAAVQQCVDPTQDFGFTISKARYEYRITADLNGSRFITRDFLGNLVPGVKVKGSKIARADVTGGFYLAETYFVKNGTLYTNLGSRQKPLQSGHRYLINALHLAVNYQDDDRNWTDFVNVAPLYSEFPVMFFDEINFYDMNDLQENEEYTKQLLDTGLYEGYNETQYTVGNQFVKTVKELPEISALDLLYRNADIRGIDLSEIMNDASSEKEEDHPWIIPAVCGFCVAVAACLIPFAVILIVKKRKKTSLGKAIPSEEG